MLFSTGLPHGLFGVTQGGEVPGGRFPLLSRRTVSAGCPRVGASWEPAEGAAGAEPRWPSVATAAVQVLWSPFTDEEASAHCQLTGTRVQSF